MPLVLAFAIQTSPPNRTVTTSILVVKAPHGCLDQQRLAHHVAAWLGEKQVDARLRVEVRGHPTRRDAVHCRVMRDTEVVVDREFQPLPPDCESTHAAVGLAIAIAIESTVLDAFMRHEVSEDGASSPRQYSREPLSPADPAGRASEADSFARRGQPRIDGIGLRISAVSAIGLHPLVGFGGQFLTELRFRRLVGLRLGGTATRGLRTDVGEGGAVVSWFAARADACLGGTTGATRLEGCAGAIYGPAIASGRDLDVTATSVTSWLAVVAGFAFTVPATRQVAFTLDLDLVVPVVRPNLVITTSDTGEVAAQRGLPAAGAMLSLGVVIQFPARAR